MNTADWVFEKSAEMIAPPARLKVSEWAEANFFVPAEGNAEPGKYRLSRMPHQAAMLDDCLEPGVSEVFYQMASQYAGKTLCLIIRCCYNIAFRKRSIQVVRDTDENAKEWLETKFLPTIEATPCMTGLLAEPRKRGSGSVATRRKFPGGTFKVIGARSRGKFRSGSFPVVEQDEIDAYDTTKEGDPCALADRATKTFPDAWKIKSSTTTLAGFSRINSGFESGDKQYYFVPCACCGGMQWLKTERMKFSFTPDEHARFEPRRRGDAEKGENEKEKTGTEESHRPDVGEVLQRDQGGYVRPNIQTVDINGESGNFQAIVNSHTWLCWDFENESENKKFTVTDTRRAIYVCEHCNHGWTDLQRIEAYKSGHPDNPAVIPNSALCTLHSAFRSEWRATAPFKGIRTRHLNGMYGTIGLKSGFVSYLHMWSEEFLAALKGGRETLMAWWNMFKNEPFEDAHEKLDWKEIQKRAEDYGVVKNSLGQCSLEPPAPVVWINWGMDIHPDRVEILFRGWGMDQESWALDYHQMFGDFDLPLFQDRVWDYISNKRFTHTVLGEMRAESGFVDCGHQTKVKAVYKFCADHTLENVWSVKGFGESLGALFVRKKERRYGGFVYSLNTDTIKDTLAARLKNRNEGANYIHFPKEIVAFVDGEQSRQLRTRFDARFYLQLVSEKRVWVKDGKNSGRFRWDKVTSSARNEGWDLLVYTDGNHEACRPDDFIARRWKQVETELSKRGITLPQAGENLTKMLAPVTEQKRSDLPKSADQQPKPRPARRKIRIGSPFGRFGRY